MQSNNMVAWLGSELSTSGHWLPAVHHWSYTGTHMTGPTQVLMSLELPGTHVTGATQVLTSLELHRYSRHWSYTGTHVIHGGPVVGGQGARLGQGVVYVDQVLHAWPVHLHLCLLVTHHHRLPAPDTHKHKKGKDGYGETIFLCVLFYLFQVIVCLTNLQFKAKDKSHIDNYYLSKVKIKQFSDPQSKTSFCYFGI